MRTQNADRADIRIIKPESLGVSVFIRMRADPGRFSYAPNNRLQIPPPTAPPIRVPPPSRRLFSLR